jgi:hypothetical protein
MAPRLSSPILLIFGAAAVLAGGCERDRAGAAEQAEDHAPWRELVAELDGDRLTVHEKLRAIDEFAARFSPDNPHEAELARRRREIERAVEADLAAQEERAREFAAQQEEELERRRAALESQTLIALAEQVLFAFAPWEDEVAEEGFSAVTMEIEGRSHRVRRAPFREVGLGTLRLTLAGLVAEVAPDLAREGDYLERHQRMNESFNRLLAGRLGAALFREDDAGALDAAALERLLEEVYVEPDATLLGTRARDLYRLVRPIVWDYARMHRFLDRRVGRDRLAAAYREALGTHDGSNHETSMLRYYERFAGEHGAAEGAGLAEPWAAPVLAGFWMRRAADGTDRVLVTFLRKVAAAYDPELAAMLSGRGRRR